MKYSLKTSNPMSSHISPQARFICLTSQFHTPLSQDEEEDQLRASDADEVHIHIFLYMDIYKCVVGRKLDRGTEVRESLVAQSSRTKDNGDMNRKEGCSMRRKS